eukprot:10426794-Alexandrium_andersonii.AAC.1
MLCHQRLVRISGEVCAVGPRWLLGLLDSVRPSSLPLIARDPQHRLSRLNWLSCDPVPPQQDHKR